MRSRGLRFEGIDALLIGTLFLFLRAECEISEVNHDLLVADKSVIRKIKASNQSL